MQCSSWLVTYRLKTDWPITGCMHTHRHHPAVAGVRTVSWPHQSRGTNHLTIQYTILTECCWESWNAEGHTIHFQCRRLSTRVHSTTSGAVGEFNSWHSCITTHTWQCHHPTPRTPLPLTTDAQSSFLADLRLCNLSCNSILTLSPPIPLRSYAVPHWSNPPFLISDIRALWRSGLSARAPEYQKLKMVG